MIYADTSFMVSLLQSDAATEAVVSVYRKLGRPILIYSPIHAMEVINALRAQQFKESLNVAPRLRLQVENQRMQAENKLMTLIKRGQFCEVNSDWRNVMERFEKISRAHTHRLGSRTLDILHVAFALEMNQKDFVTCDARQAALAKAEGFKVHQVRMA